MGTCAVMRCIPPGADSMPRMRARLVLRSELTSPMLASGTSMVTFMIGSRSVALANATLLEPIMNVTIEVPEANMGDVNSDLNTKRARILGMESAPGGMQRITAQVPMAEMLHYATDLRSITQGRGTFTMEVAEYEEVPSTIQHQIVESYKKEKGGD